MPAYAYTIKVNYDREIVKESKSKLVKSPLTIKKLTKIVGDNSFSVQDEDEVFSNDYIVSWVEKGPETDREMSTRIAKGEKYNKNREEFRKEHGITN